MKCYAEQVVRDANQVLHDEYRHQLGEPQKRQESNTRSKAGKSVDTYVAFQILYEMNMTRYVHDEVHKHGILLQKIEGQVKCADTVFCRVQHAPEAVLLQELTALCQKFI